MVAKACHTGLALNHCKCSQTVDCTTIGTDPEKRFLIPPPPCTCCRLESPYDLKTMHTRTDSHAATQALRNTSYKVLGQVVTA